MRRGINLLSNVILKFRLNRAPLIKTTSSFLDIGCGSGGWLRFLSDRGFATYGIDPSLNACLSAKSHGIKRIFQGMPSFFPIRKESFDVITAIHCLEHDPEPKLFLRAAAAVLKPGGWMGVALPNVDSWEVHRAGGSWYHLDPPYHLCLPHRKALEKVLLDLGFEKPLYQYPMLEFSQSWLYAFFKRQKLPFLMTMLLSPIFAMCNSYSALMKRSGVIEIWIRKKQIHSKEFPSCNP
jgi:SAM-dependent methyltransferase